MAQKSASLQNPFQPSLTESSTRSATADKVDAAHRLWLDSAAELYAPRSSTGGRIELIANNDAKVLTPRLEAPAPASVSPKSPESDPPLDRYEDQVKALAQRPRPHDGSSIFVGSSTFAKWTDLEKVFKKHDAHDLAFGGSTIPEINHYFDRLFDGYTPKDVVFYAGTNDIAELHHSSAQVLQDFQKFEKKFHEKYPKSDLIFVSISAAPSRLDRKADLDEANRLVKGYLDKTPHCKYVDVTHVMGDHYGHAVDAKLFLPDALHMNGSGYDRWEPIIEDALEHPNRKHRR